MSEKQDGNGAMAYNVAGEQMLLFDDNVEVVIEDDGISDDVVCPLCGESMDAKVMDDDGAKRVGFYCNCNEYQQFEDFVITQLLNQRLL